MEYRTKILIVEGNRIETAAYGPSPADAPTLVFLHEGLGCVSLWKDFPKRLSEITGYGTFMYSRLGYGGSGPSVLPRPVTFMHDEASRLLPLILKEARIHQHLLIGHSDGGSIALIYAGKNQPETLAGIITEAPHVFCEDKLVRSITKVVQAYEKGGLRDRLEKHHGDNIENAFWGWANVWRDPDFAHWNIEAYLAKIRVPVLVIQGADDEYATLAQVQSIVAKCGAPAASLILEACGHSPHGDQESETLQAMATFVAKVLPAESTSTPTA